jgi:hypothetical protein
MVGCRGVSSNATRIQVAGQASAAHSGFLLTLCGASKRILPNMEIDLGLCILGVTIVVLIAALFRPYKLMTRE